MIFRAIVLAHGAAAAYLLLGGVPRSMPPLARTGLALLALLPVFGYWLWPRAQRVPAARARQRVGWLDRLSLGTVALALLCAFGWLLSAAPEPLESLSLTLEEQLRPQAAQQRQETRQHRGQPQQGNWLWNHQSRRPLPKRTDFKPSNRPEIFLRLADPGDAAELLHGQIYVRAFALSRYDRQAWCVAGQAETLRADATGLVQLATPVRRTIAHQVFHPYDPHGQNVLTALQGVAAAQVPELTRLDEGLFVLPPAPQPSGYEYTAASAPLNLEDLPETPDLPGWPRSPEMLTAGPAPDALARKIHDLAVIAAGTGTTQQRLLNLRNHLRTTLRYSLECDNPGDLDPLENFLFAEQRGHCEYFATAGAMMARAIGVPARVAYGWAGGTYYEHSNLFVFRAREAHAWTEVCLAGQGWVILDATPPEGIRSDRATVARPDEKPPAPVTAAPESPEESAATTTPAGFARWLTLGLALPALILLGWRGLSRRRAHEGAPDASQPLVETPHYFTVWRRAAARRGHPLPAGMTLRGHLRGLPHRVPFAAELLEYHYAVRYRGAKADPRREKQLAAAIRRWEHDGGTGSAG